MTRFPFTFFLFCFGFGFLFSFKFYCLFLEERLQGQGQMKGDYFLKQFYERVENTKICFSFYPSGVSECWSECLSEWQAAVGFGYCCCSLSKYPSPDTHYRNIQALGQSSEQRIRRRKVVMMPVMSVVNVQKHLLYRRWQEHWVCTMLPCQWRGTRNKGS